MTARALGAFSPVLREVEAELSLPIPERVRILRELEADLIDLSERFVAQGLSAEEARARAREALVPDRGALRELHHLHTPLYRKMTRHIAGDRLRMAERGALLLTSAVVVVMATAALLSVDLLSHPSPFLWPVMAQGGVLFAMTLAKAFQLWVKRDHTVPSRGLGGMLAVAGATLGTGVFGVMVDFYRIAGTLEAAPELAGDLIADWLVRDASLLSVSILVALAGGLAWFVLAQWVTLLEEDHRDVLGLSRQSSSDGVG